MAVEPELLLTNHEDVPCFEGPSCCTWAGRMGSSPTFDSRSDALKHPDVRFQLIPTFRGGSSRKEA
jgi:hypothetical protein